MRVTCHKPSLSITITLIFLVLAGAITTAFFSIYYNSVTDILRERALSGMNAGLGNIRAMILDNFNTWSERIKLSSISVLPYMNGGPPNARNIVEMRAMLQRIGRIQQDFTHIVCISNNRWNEPGGFYVNTNETVIPADDYDNTKRPWFISAKQAHGGIVFSPPFISETTGDLITSIALDVLNDSGVSAGVMYGTITIKFLNDIISQENRYKQQSTYVLNREGLYITNNDHAKILNDNFFTEEQIEAYQTIVLSVDSFAQVINEKIVCANYIPLADWHLVTTVPVSVLLAEVRAFFIRMSLIALAVFIASSVLVAFLTRTFIVKPIKEAEHIAEALAAADFSVAIPDNRSDEIGSMQAAFVKIRDNLSGKIQSLNNDLVNAKEKAEAERDKAERANRAKSNFLASMSHEIRTPMNAIIGMSELIHTDNFDATQKNYFADIRKMTHALLQIINDILDFSKIEVGKMEFVSVHFNLFDLYENICSLAVFTASGKSIVFTHTFSEKLPAVVYGDEIRIRQIITNVVTNAIKYTQKGSVNLDAKYLCKDDGKEYMVFTVHDTGIGIKKEDISKIFIAFEQVDIEKNRGIMGTGLGLAITNKFIEMMGGAIAVESEYGCGSTFTVTLPLVRGDPSLVKKEQKVNFIVKENIKILVVDDVSINLTVACGFLSIHGIVADTAQGALQAVEKIKSTAYDLIFMDHMMPELDGVEATKMIRKLYTASDPATERFRDVPIVALTANAIAGMRDYFLQAGMNDFISKPIESTRLSEIILKFLPKEKIVYTDGNEETFNNSGEYQELINKLAALEDLDVKKGLSFLRNNERIYINMLSQFCDEAYLYADELTRLCAEENWNAYAIKSHAIKGISAGLSCEKLCSWALKLEEAAKAGNGAFCTHENEGFCASLRDLAGKMRAMSLGAKPSEERLVLDRASLTAALHNLMAYCEQTLAGELGASENAERYADELSRTACDGEEASQLLAGLYQLIHNFDYDKALENIRQLLAQLESAPPQALPAVHDVG
ncbi:MAG: response regulator [Spirochaetaceae bacterium]|jgi:signal transduction histidine kinase/CheY-like chemotaxis protein|nr:response regulator [Spirochaetaceae bacterium]